MAHVPNQLTRLAETFTRLNSFDGILEVWLECSGVPHSVLSEDRLQQLKDDARANIGMLYSDHLWGVYGALRIVYEDHPKGLEIASAGAMLYAAGERIRETEVEHVYIHGLTQKETMDVLSHLNCISYRILGLHDVFSPAPSGYLLH